MIMLRMSVAIVTAFCAVHLNESNFCTKHECNTVNGIYFLGYIRFIMNTIVIFFKLQHSYICKCAYICDQEKLEIKNTTQFRRYDLVIANISMSLINFFFKSLFTTIICIDHPRELRCNGNAFVLLKLEVTPQMSCTIYSITWHKKQKSLIQIE